MIINSTTVAIIADDLTGANDTALQFHLKGANTQILLSEDIDPINAKNTQTWALSTESRNIEPHEAFQKALRAAQFFVEKINPDYFYKKIDSTIRGNIAVEVLAILDTLEWDASIIIPAFPAESRVTVGGYHLLKGVPIERTEMARDPHSPIFESHLPTLLKSQLHEENKDLVGSIELSTIMKGAGPILRDLNNLIKSGKKLIVMDAVSTVDIEQIVLAMDKSEYRILPTGTAAAAQVLSDLWFSDFKSEHITKTLPELPKFVVSGSATQITANQIEKLEEADEFENLLVINLDMKTVLAGVSDEIVNRIVNNLGQNNIVVVHTSTLVRDFDGFSEDSLNAELTKANLANVITDFLAELTQKVVAQKELILITLGGETSYKCCSAIGATQLQLIDEVAPAIALSLDHNAQWIVTKSGNLGGVNTLIDILKYFELHE
ncbi:MAG: four-carbon acid sugar kinase family protein [Brachyspira sp.]|nr:four-carbon acid sugar kinase family protein [Brachyspira sp.]